MILLGVIVGVIIGIYKILTIPAPKEPMSKRELNYYYNGGWKEYNRLEEIRAELAEIEKERAEQEIQNALGTLAHLENQKEQLYRIYDMVNYELERETDTRKRTTLYNKLRTIDNQIFSIDQKIKKILDY